MTFDLEANFKELDVTRWIKKTLVKYSKLCVTIESILLAFPSLYVVEFEFSQVYYLLSKQKHFKQRMCWLVVQIHKSAT